MRVPSHVLVAGVLVAGVSASVWAGEQPPIAERPPVAPLPSRPMQQVLPSRTLTMQQLMREAQAAAGRYQQLHPVQQPVVICGLTLLPADPKADASIRVRPPSTGVNPMIERVSPQVCKGAGASSLQALPQAPRPVLPQTPR
jgi:hypothetical protein